VTAPIWHPSPNFGPRRGGLTPRFVVLHYTQMADAPSALARLCDPAAEVSAHYLIGAQGAVWQMVVEEMRAWHAGAGEWQGLDDMNSRSIGIELDNDGESPFPWPQMRALEGLLTAIRARWEIAPKGVIAHSDMAPARKHDPGARFDWRGLARAGHAIWPEPGDVGTTGALMPLLRAIGYADVPQARAAFRLRFRPMCPPDAPEDATDIALARAVLSKCQTGRHGPS